MAERKDSATREKEFRLAILRIERGRAHNKAEGLSISAVAREAGVTPALIHNHYPAVAELIRAKQGASSRQQRDHKHEELTKERRKNAELRRELDDLRRKLARLASINEMLLVENVELTARHQAENITSMNRRQR